MKGSDMNGSKVKLLAISLACLLLGSVSMGFNNSAPAATGKHLDEWTQTALTDFKNKVPQAAKVLREAKGILVFPHLYNAGFVVGARYGEGELLTSGVVNNYYNLVGLSWGWQIGGQRQALIIAFMTQDALHKFQQSEGWDLGADATVAIADVGTQGDINLSRLNKPVLAFAVDQKGLMAGVSLEGSKITKIHE